MSSADPVTASDPSGLPAAISGTLPTRFRNFVARQLELIFVVVLISTVTAVFWLIPYYKIAFLNLFYLPVLLAAYFLGRRRAVLGATFCILLVALFALLGPSWFVTSGTLVLGYDMDTMVLIATWGGFLILTSAAIGSLQEKLNRGFVEIRQLYEDLKQSRVAEEMKEKVEKTLFATMDPTVAKLAIQGKLRYEKREISIMFTDLTDFTSYSDQNRPDVVLEELNRFLGEIEPVVETFRGHIDKFMGDGVMIEYGAAHRLRASRAAGRPGRTQDAGEREGAQSPLAPAGGDFHRQCGGRHDRLASAVLQRTRRYGQRSETA